MIRLLLTWITGFKGMPIPYSPKLDDGITIAKCSWVSEVACES